MRTLNGLRRRTYEKHWCSSYYQCPFQPLHPIRIPRASFQRQRTPLSMKRIWGLPEAQWHTARIGVTIPSYRQWPSEAFRSNIQEMSASIRGRWNLQLRIQNFLFTYRSTQHATTGTTPAKLFLLRELRRRLSLVHPDISLHVTNNQTKMKSYCDRHTKFRTLSPGERESSCKGSPLQRKVAHRHYCYTTRCGLILHPSGWWPTVAPSYWWPVERSPSEPDCISESAHSH